MGGLAKEGLDGCQRISAVMERIRLSMATATEASRSKSIDKQMYHIPDSLHASRLIRLVETHRRIANGLPRGHMQVGHVRTECTQPLHSHS
jgi:hypothetical protein